MRRAWYRLVGWVGTVITTRWLHAPLYRWTGGWGPLGRSLGILTVVLVTAGARTARSASSSWASGTPHTAMTASPMNFSTVPP